MMMREKRKQRVKKVSDDCEEYEYEAKIKPTQTVEEIWVINDKKKLTG